MPRFLNSEQIMKSGINIVAFRTKRCVDEIDSLTQTVPPCEQGEAGVVAGTRHEDAKPL